MTHEKLAKQLFIIYKAALPNADIKVDWDDLPEEMKDAWIVVATSADLLLTEPSDRSNR